MTTQNADYDAAQALLDLQGQFVWRASNSREEMERTSKWFLNCFISSEIPVVSVPKPNGNETCVKSEGNGEYPSTFRPFENKPKHSNTTDTKPFKKIFTNESHDQPSSSSTPFRPRLDISLSQRTPVNPVNGQRNSRKTYNKNAIETREMATQTEESYFNPHIEFMETTIKNLCERIQSLEAQLKQPHLPNQNSSLVSPVHEDDQSFESQQKLDLNTSLNDNADKSRFYRFSRSIQFPGSDVFGADEDDEHRNNVTVHRNSSAKMSDLVPIGDGHAAVPARILKHINWNSYTSATRKLLTAVFSRRVLATHSLTGKPSPAFPNKPAKKKLDPALINDIVQTVVERCSVPENVVRTSITTKCADESKMFKTRQSCKRRRPSKNNSENIPPTTSDSESED